ncbi:metal ABC transporter permease [Granulosicoccaceae sp. 1_MG-2023]|nr:metal ABC transporter permease [Granulosicoccaceae sp. 1_MG-2023]
MIDAFILRALAAGIGVALVTAALGCFVVWRRMAYFGDSLSHSALLGIALGLLAGVGINAGILIVCSVFALLLVWLQHQHILATDTLLGILAHSALSVGMVVISLMEFPNFDLHSYLFGDILTVQRSDLMWIYGGGFFVIGVILWQWTSLTLMTISEELAQAEGVNTFVANLILMMMMTVVVAASVRIVGILLVSSLLIIPAATARQWARSPETMALTAAVFGVLAVILGILASAYFDTPSGPSIVSAAALAFFVTLGIQTTRGRTQHTGLD